MKLLIAAGTTLTEPTDVPPGVSLLVDAAAEIAVMSPSLVGPLDWLTGDVDTARHEADERLAASLDQIDSDDRTVTGTRGDELLRAAFDDAARRFEPDHVVIVLSDDDYKVWERQKVLKHLLTALRLPVTVFAVP